MTAQKPASRWSDSPQGEKFKREMIRTRLIITIPVLMIIFPIISGIFQYHLILTQAEKITDPAIKLVFQETLMSLWISTGALIIIATTCGTLLAFYITRPIKKLIKSADEIAGGDLQSMVELQTKDEFSALSNSFNQMVQSLNRTIQERNRYILECYTGGLITVDLAGRVMAINSAAEQILQTRGSELMGQLFLDFLEQRTGCGQFARVVRQGLEEGRFVQSQELAIATDDGGAFPLMVSTSLLKGRQESAKGVIINFRDLTQFNAFYRRLTRTDRLATAGTLAMGVAHEIRNPLAAIRGMAQLLQQDAPAGSEMRNYADVIVAESRRLDGVVSGLLDFSQPEEAVLEPCNLNDIIQRALHGVKQRRGEEGRLPRFREEYGELPRLELHGEKLTQAFANILSNATEIAPPPTGCVWIKTQTTEIAGADGALTPVVCAEIANNGPPIPPEHLEQIFEPFYSKREGGAGLGLPIAYQIVTFSGGRIDVVSHRERTTFTITFNNKAAIDHQ